MSKVLIIGGGAAGMMAAITAAKKKHTVELFEKNEKCGKKIYITGKGRCNMTNAGDMDDILGSIVTNKKFMYSALYSFSNYDTMGFFDELGLAIKVERGNRVFPESDHSSDVISAMVGEMNKCGVKIRYNTEIIDICTDKNNHFSHIVTSNKEKVYGDAVVIATGGLSYPSTGSTGAGYEFAKKLGHTIVKPVPALVPFNTKEEYVRNLQGLSLRNIAVRIMDGKKEVYSDFGELLFTHFGVSGPTIISASSKLTKLIEKNQLKLYIDMKPALCIEQLDERILRDFDANKNKSFKNSLDDLLPKKMIPVIIDLSGIDENKKVNEVSKIERGRLVELLKNFPITLLNLRGFNEAIITQGGVNVKEINPSTMESKLVGGVYFAGEVLDVDAVTGGFNLQIAWSSGHLCAESIE